MADDEEVSLFSKPQSTYTADNSPAVPAQQSDDGSESYHNQAPVTRDGPDAGSSPDGTGQTQTQGPGNFHIQDGPEVPYAIPPFDEVLGNVHEKAMAEAGFGKAQWSLFVVLGLGLMGDGIELLMIAYVLPGAEKDLCMDDQMKGWLGAIAFAGMLVGAIIWGNLADKVGRKPTLMTALSFNLVFTLIGAFVPTYWLFLLCRLLSGVGIGGSIPIVVAYFGEFCTRPGRGWKIGLILTFWVLGGVYVSALGWLIIPNKDFFDLNLSADTSFHSWRIFILICLVPVLLSVLGLFAMPESPRFLLQVGRDLEALAVYRKVYKWNHTELGAEYEMPEIELPNNAGLRGRDEPGEPGSYCTGVAHAFENFWNSFFQLFYSPLTVTTLVLCVTWFSTAFGYYGLSIWFPEYIKKIEQGVYFAQTNITRDITLANQGFTDLLDNIHFYNVTFVGVTFKDMELRHVTFDLCRLADCLFANVTTSKTYFVDSVIERTVFNTTNLYAYKFKQSPALDSEFYNLQKGCQVDFDINYSSKQVFLENFLCQLAVLPGSLMSAALMDTVGRVRLLVVGLLISAISVFFIWFTDTEIAVVCMNAIFNCVINCAFNSIDVASMELYPTHLRATAFGFLSSLGRIAAILGNVAFGNFIAVSKAIPILLTAAILGLGALVSLKLPESKDKVL